MFDSDVASFPLDGAMNLTHFESVSESSELLQKSKGRLPRELSEQAADARQALRWPRTPLVVNAMEPMVGHKRMVDAIHKNPLAGGPTPKRRQKAGTGGGAASYQSDGADTQRTCGASHPKANFEMAPKAMKFAAIE